MFGTHLEPAEATVLDTTHRNNYLKLELVLDVHPPTGPAFRATASYHTYSAGTMSSRGRSPQVGDVVNVKYHPKSLKVALDLKEDPRYGKIRMSLERHLEQQETEARRAALLAAPPGMPLASSNLLSTLTGHTFPVHTVAWSPDGRLLASGSLDNPLRIWNPANSQTVTTLEEDPEDGFVTSVAWSPDGRLVAFCGRTTNLWNASTSERYPPLIPRPEFEGYRVNSVAWSPDSRSLASAYDDGTIILWDAITLTQRAILKGHTGAVNGVAWSPDGRRLASGSKDETVRLWEVSTGQTLTTIPAHPFEVLSVAWSPDGRYLACGGGHDPRVWDASTGKRLLYHWVGPSIIWEAAWSPDGRRLATASGDQTVRLWDIQQNHHLATFFGHTADYVFAVAWSPDGRVLASGGEDQTVRLWRVG